MIEVYREQYCAKKLYIRDSSKIGDFLLIGITTNDILVFKEFHNGNIINQAGFNISWYREKGVEVENLKLKDFVGHECYPTFEKYINQFNDFEFHAEVINIGFIGLCFNIDDCYTARYFDSTLGAFILFQSDILKSASISEATEFLFLNFYKIRDKVIEILFNQYKYFKEEVLDWELDEDEILQYPEINEVEEVRKLIEFTSIYLFEFKEDFKFQLGGDCSWDPEHGFSLRIDRQLNIEEL